MTSPDKKAAEEKKDEEMIDTTEKKEEEKKPEPEPLTQELSNPSRVMRGQERHISYDKPDNPKWQPVLKKRFAGFIMLKIAEGYQPTGDEVAEAYYDDEERDETAVNPDLVTDIELPKSFIFNPAIQDAE